MTNDIDAMNTIRTKNQLALICRQASILTLGLTERYVLGSILHYVARMNVETYFSGGSKERKTANTQSCIELS